MVSEAPLQERASTCSWSGMVKLVAYESALGMGSLRVEPGEIVWKSYAHHLDFGRARYYGEVCSTYSNLS